MKGHYIAAAITCIALANTAATQAKAGLERLYILNCGEGVAGVNGTLELSRLFRDRQLGTDPLHR